MYLTAFIMNRFSKNTAFRRQWLLNSLIGGFRKSIWKQFLQINKCCGPLLFTEYIMFLTPVVNFTYIFFLVHNKYFTYLWFLSSSTC